MAIVAFYSYAFLFYYFRGLRASRVINTQLIDSVFGSTLRSVFGEFSQNSEAYGLMSMNRWLDETPTARIIARCTQDIHAIDESIPGTFMMLTEVIIGTLTQLAAVVVFTPLFLIPGVAAAALGLCLGNMYLKTQLAVKREMRYVYPNYNILEFKLKFYEICSNSRSPLLAHFSATIQGLGASIFVNDEVFLI